MIEVPCPTCGQKTLEPDRPEDVRNQEQKVAFRKDWDARVQAGGG